MPSYDFTRPPAREFSLQELVEKISELEHRRQARGQPRDDASRDGSENPWRAPAEGGPPAAGRAEPMTG